MGNSHGQACWMEDNVDQLVETILMPDEKPSNMSDHKPRKLCAKPEVIDQQMPGPAPPPVQALVQERRAEAREEPYSPLSALHMEIDQFPGFAPPAAQTPAQERKAEARTEPDSTLSNLHKAIDQQFPGPSEPAVQAGVRERKLEPDLEPIKMEKTKPKGMPKVVVAQGCDTEIFIISQEFRKKSKRLFKTFEKKTVVRVRSGPSFNDAVSYTFPSVGNIELKVNMNESLPDWWKVCSAIDKNSGKCIGLAGWVSKKHVDGTDTLSRLSTRHAGEEQIFYTQRKP